MPAHWILKQCPPPVLIYFSKFNNINYEYFFLDSGSYFIRPHVSKLKAAVFPLLEVKHSFCGKFVEICCDYATLTSLSFASKDEQSQYGKSAVKG
jgi:hypothetical protein